MKIRKIKRKVIPPCDCHVGVDYSSRSPHILRCKNQAVYEVEIPYSVLGKIWYRVCENCLPRIKETYDK